MPEYTVVVPVQYRNSERVTVNAASEEEAIEIATNEVNAYGVIERAVNHDEGVASILYAEAYVEDAEDDE